MESEATDLPTEVQPLPESSDHYYEIYCTNILIR